MVDDVKAIKIISGYPAFRVCSSIKLNSKDAEIDGLVCTFDDSHTL